MQNFNDRLRHKMDENGCKFLRSVEKDKLQNERYMKQQVKIYLSDIDYYIRYGGYKEDAEHAIKELVRIYDV
ncbi:hypothetical protein [Halobacillus litoralis]|uniref:hypothetical protein n=1 Tax=Halobacillus litoralis TaxID=45668 RepID=UPI001CD7E0C6|nr:hypothetical protein [Halobacillus litoralis]MCA1021532.1 hypothetical protein [Halobacillus litoralis]